MQRLELELHLLAQIAVKRREWLVEEQQARLGDDGAGKRHALALATSQATVQAPVAVLIGVDIDETKGRRRRLKDGIDAAAAHPLIGGDQAGDDGGEVLRPRADEFRQGIAIMVALAEENAV